jgi:hypothetical protein
MPLKLALLLAVSVAALAGCDHQVYEARRAATPPPAALAR